MTLMKNAHFDIEAVLKLMKKDQHLVSESVYLVGCHEVSSSEK